MDNKNLILAVVLSVVILWAYTTFLAPAPMTHLPAQTSHQGPAAAASGQASTAQAASAAYPASPNAASAPVVTHAPDVVVDTPLYRAVFSQKGGALRRIILKKFTQAPGGQGGEYVLLDLGPNDLYSLGLNLPKVDPELANRLFSASAKSLSLAPGQPDQKLSFTASSNGLTVNKTYVFHADGYAFDLKVNITNSGGQALEVSPELTLAEHADKAKVNTYAFTGSISLRDGRLLEMDHGDLKKGKVESGDITWMSMNIPYFMGAVIPAAEQGSTAPVRSVRGFSDDVLLASTLVEPLRGLAPGQSTSLAYQVYYGPRDLEVLEGLGHQVVKAIDFGWFDIIAKPMLVALNFCEGFLGNYGLAIILVTLIIKLLFWPLSQKSYRSMKKMQEIQPLVAKLRDKYGDDKMKLQQETMQLYKTYKVNPMGGCLPMVLQIPVFIAFYKVLGSAIELRQAPFMLWINDLAAPDRLPIGFDIPYVGHGIPVLTLLMGASMFLQQKMTPTTGDPTQAKIMLLMPVVFTFMFINFPSGLVLYWFINNVLSIGQQFMTNRQKAK